MVSCNKPAQATEEKAEITTPASQELDAIRTAHELAKYGYEVESASALIEAAKIDGASPIKMYFHITLTPYKKDIEPHIPPKGKVIESIKKLSNIIGKENLVIRYDPIFISEEYSLDYHVKAFDKLCELLDGYVCKILIHFINDYKNVRNNYSTLKYRKLTEKDYEIIGRSFSESAKKHNIVVHTCNEERDLTEFGFIKDDCISKELAFKLTGKIYKKKEGK